MREAGLLQGGKPQQKVWASSGRFLGWGSNPVPVFFPKVFAFWLLSEMGTRQTSALTYDLRFWKRCLSATTQERAAPLRKPDRESCSSASLWFSANWNPSNPLHPFPSLLQVVPMPCRPVFWERKLFLEGQRHSPSTLGETSARPIAQTAVLIQLSTLRNNICRLLMGDKASCLILERSSCSLI